jgi:hypothetical protein
MYAGREAELVPTYQLSAVRDLDGLHAFGERLTDAGREPDVRVGPILVRDLDDVAYAVAVVVVRRGLEQRVSARRVP